jgi:DNA/RNA-binding domain of Phe-tRNA-synthetase-like protein
VNEGWIDPAVRVEFPGLRLVWCTVTAPVGERSPPEVRERLRQLSDRVRGSEALLLRTRPVPHAYRVFFRHVGMDPDRTRVPIEAVILERLRRGHFRSRSLLDDAITIAVVETGVGVWALDAAHVEGELGVGPGDDGRLWICDASGPVAPLFGDPGIEHGATPATQRVALYAVEVPGVPAGHVEEALWIAGDVLGDE